MNTETPMEMSLVASLSLHISSPYGHDSTVYTVDVNGTHVIMTNRSPRARLSMYVLGTFRMLRCLMNTSTRVPLPSTPTTNIIANTTGTMYVSGRFEYGTYTFSSYVSATVDPFMVYAESTTWVLYGFYCSGAAPANRTTKITRYCKTIDDEFIL